jgi:hypothetical protein
MDGKRPPLTSDFLNLTLGRRCSHISRAILSWIPACERVRRHILEDNTARGDHSSRPNLHTGADECAGGDPTAVVNDDWTGEQLKIFPPIIVAAGAKIGALTDADIRSDRHLRKSQDSNVFPDPDTIANYEAPRERHIDITANDNAGSCGSPEGSNEHNPQPRRPGHRILKENGADKNPQCFFPTCRAAIEVGIIVNT